MRNEETAYRWTFTGERWEMSMVVERVVAGDEVLNEPDQLRAGSHPNGREGEYLQFRMPSSSIPSGL